jgi:quinol monooxygenase YgiN
MPQQSQTPDPARRRVLLCAASICVAIPAVPTSQARNPSMKSATIEPNPELTTLVNTFTVAQKDCEQLVSLLKEGTRAWICKVPGFVSSALHVSRDRQRVVIYGQWRSADAIAAMRQSPEMPAYFARIKAVATMEGIVCDVSSTMVA